MNIALASGTLSFVTVLSLGLASLACASAGEDSQEETVENVAEGEEALLRSGCRSDGQFAFQASGKKLRSYEGKPVHVLALEREMTQ